MAFTQLANIDTSYFPIPLVNYAPGSLGSVWEALSARLAADPFNGIATLLFLLAIVHTFLTAHFARWAHHVQDRYERQGGMGASFAAVILEFLGEVEVVFGLWVLPLMVAMVFYYGWEPMIHYFNFKVIYTEPIFVGVIMAIASTKPILELSEGCLKRVAAVGKQRPSAWWLSILTIGPLLGSFITEPAAMTIAALLLGRYFYKHAPTTRLKYATLGLLFVNVSVGGTLTHFAAPPIVMVVEPWGWDLPFVFSALGWRAAIGIILANIVYFLIFRRDLKQLDLKVSHEPHVQSKDPKPTPFWVYLVHIGFLTWTVLQLHSPALCVGGFLFFLGFMKASSAYQSPLNLRSPLLVSFFLAGLVTHGTLQGWWLEVVLSRLGEWSLFFGATILTAFNDNAAITFLSTLVPEFATNTALQQAVVTGAVTGGGLTVIANAPNPAGQSILSKYFDDASIAPLYLFFGALLPTIIVGSCLMLL